MACPPGYPLGVRSDTGSDTQGSEPWGSEPSFASRSLCLLRGRRAEAHLRLDRRTGWRCHGARDAQEKWCWWVRRALGRKMDLLPGPGLRPALRPGAGPCLAVALFSRLTYELCVMSATNVSHSLGHTYVTVFTCSPHSPAVDPGSPPGGGDSRPVHSTMR